MKNYTKIAAVSLLILNCIVPLHLQAGGEQSKNKNKIEEINADEWFEAAANDDKTKIKELLEKGIPVDLRCELGCSALMLASIKGYYELAKFLLDKGASVCLGHKLTERTALDHAASWGQDRVAQLLIEKGAEVNKENRYDFKTPLIYAAMAGHYKVVKVLLLNGATLNNKKLPENALALIQQCQEDIRKEKILLLTLARERCSDSVLDKDYLTRNLFDYVLHEAKLLKDFEHNHKPEEDEKEGKEEIQLPASESEELLEWSA